MSKELDYIARFAMTKNFDIRPRTVFVEGTTDVRLFELAAQLEKSQTGVDLLGNNLAIIAAGEGDFGGTTGVCRELVSFKNMATGCLLPNGRQKYRFVGLFDNDLAGRRAISDVRKIDTSILEFKDVFLLWPMMPFSTNRDPDALRRMIENENVNYHRLDWEVEDLLPESLTEAFVSEYPTARRNSVQKHDKVHNDWTTDGKARLHRYVKMNAIHADLVAVITVLRSLWSYLGIRLPTTR